MAKMMFYFFPTSILFFSRIHSQTKHLAQEQEHGRTLQEYSLLIQCFLIILFQCTLFGNSRMLSSIHCQDGGSLQLCAQKHPMSTPLSLITPHNNGLIICLCFRQNDRMPERGTMNLYPYCPRSYCRAWHNNRCSINQ